MIPGSAAVLVLGLATMVAQDRSLLGDGDRWLLVSLILHVALARRVKLAVVAAIIALMVTRSF